EGLLGLGALALLAAATKGKCGRRVGRLHQEPRSSIGRRTNTADLGRIEFCELGYIRVLLDLIDVGCHVVQLLSDASTSLVGTPRVAPPSGDHPLTNPALTADQPSSSQIEPNSQSFAFMT